jgi:glycosyltransferase involved in cell wall biosynthesis
LPPESGPGARVGVTGTGPEGFVVRSARGALQRPVVVHLTTVDLSLALLLLPQLVAFREAGYDVVGVSAAGEHVRDLEATGIRHIALERSTRAADLRADVAAARDFLAVCRRLRPDIVHTHNPKPGIYGRLDARLARVPAIVNTVHGLYAQPNDPTYRRAVVYGLERIAATCSDAELVQNPEDLPVLRKLGIPDRKLQLLGNGVDLARFDPDRHLDARSQVRHELGIDDDEVVVGLVGRLVAEKGFREVFEAARQLRITNPKVRFVIAGPPDLAKADAIGQTELDRAASEARVHFLGMRADVERLYPAFDLYVLASHREGFPRSAMEAAAMGLPIVATDIRGCRQVVDDRATGLLVPLRDPMALGAAIDRLAGDPQLRRSMGDAARAKAVREFDDRQQVRITLDVYDRLLQRARRRSARRS